MQGAQHYTLGWNDFANSTSEAFKGLYSDTNFADVTLVCENDKKIAAHKVVLSSSSDFFKTILINNPHQHPLLYLKGTKFLDLQLIIQFMYSGQTQVAQNRLPGLMKTAEELEIKGLTAVQSKNNNSRSSEKIDSVEEFVGNSIDESGTNNEEEFNNRNIVAMEESSVTDDIRHTFVKDSLIPMSSDGENVGNALDSNSDLLKKNIKEESSFSSSNNCGLSPINGSKRVKCELCGKEFSNKQNATRHRQYAHEGIKYPCQQCNHKASTMSNLKTHQKGHHSELL